MIVYMFLLFFRILFLDESCSLYILLFSTHNSIYLLVSIQIVPVSMYHQIKQLWVVFGADDDVCFLDSLFL